MEKGVTGGAEKRKESREKVRRFSEQRNIWKDGDRSRRIKD